MCFWMRAVISHYKNSPLKSILWRNFPTTFGKWLPLANQILWSCFNLMDSLSWLFFDLLFCRMIFLFDLWEFSSYVWSWLVHKSSSQDMESFDDPDQLSFWARCLPDSIFHPRYCFLFYLSIVGFLYLGDLFLSYCIFLVSFLSLSTLVGRICIQKPR